MDALHDDTRAAQFVLRCQAADEAEAGRLVAELTTIYRQHREMANVCERLSDFLANPPEKEHPDSIGFTGAIRMLNKIVAELNRPPA